MKQIALLLMFSVLLLFSGCDSLNKEETGNIYGLVTNSFAEPLRGANVSLYDGPAPSSTIIGISIVGDLLLSTVVYDDGHFEFNNLTPGSYGILVKCDGYREERSGVRVESGRVARMDFSLHKK